MKIYISADIEGIAGITAPDEANPEHRDVAYFQENSLLKDFANILPHIPVNYVL